MVTKTKRKVKISRSKWLRGDVLASYMADDKGHMCCLGFAANQISHLTKKAMCKMSEPADVYKKPSFLTKFEIDPLHGERSLIENNKFTDDAMNINDDNGLSEKMREYKLKRLFSKNGINLEFVD